MESVVPFILDHALYAHWVIFGLFMLAGLNFPISEDILIIFSGVLASTTVPENTWKLFIAVFLGAFISDWFPYWIGRLFGHNLWKIRWFSRMIKEERLVQIQSYYERYGVLTLLVGRFIPFGVRNCLFVTAGMGQMSFPKFLLCDGIACMVSNAVLFSLAFYFGITTHLKVINIGIFSTFLVAMIGFLCYKKLKRA